MNINLLNSWSVLHLKQKLYSLKKLLVLSCFMAFISTGAFAQTIVKGIIFDNDKQPLPGATIQVVGSTMKSQSDNEGKYQISVPSGTAKLTVSFVGYETQTVSVNNQSIVNITMASLNNLDAVVVIGYASVRKSDLTGAVANVSAKDFNKGPVTAPDQLIQGKVAGVQLTANSGQPGGANTVRIRGNSAIAGTGQPLYVVDGVALDGRSARPGLDAGSLGVTPGGNPLNFINPSDIESMEILKDASATAIYGSRGAYGVVLITTKRGKVGDLKTDLSMSAGVSNIMRSIDVMNGDEYRAALNTYGITSGNEGQNVDALKAITRTAYNQNYSLNMSGGRDEAKFRFSLGYQDIDGIIKGSNFTKYTAGATGNFKFLENKKLGLDINVITSQYSENIAPVSNNAGYQGSVLGQALSWNPTKSLYNADGSVFVGTGTTINPVAMLEAFSDKSKVTTALGSFSPYYKIAKGLEYRMLASVNYSTGTRRSSIRSIINLEDIQSRGGFANIGSNELITLQNTHTLNYTADITAGLSLNAVVGYEYMKYINKGSNSSAYGFDNTPIDYTNIMQYSPTDKRTLTSFNDPKSELQSEFARATLNYKNRYIVTGTFRVDGSTKFGTNNKYGYFPSFSAAWNIKNESFFNIEAISALKLRGGWGKTGNQEFPAGASQERYAATGPLTFALVNNANLDLKWQSDEQTNLGIDFGIFKGRITGSVDYFSKKTTDLLYPRIPYVPSSPSAAITWVNLPGIIKNSGVELALSAQVVAKEDFTWDLSANATFIKNSVSNMPNTILTGNLNGQGLSGVTTEVIQNGLPLFAMVTKQFEGLDANGFSQYTDGGFTYYYVGNPNPSTLLGISTTVAYKKLSLTANLNGALGQDIYNNTANGVISISNLGSKNIAKNLVGGPIKESLANPISASSRYIEDGSYLKLANATLNYRVGNLGKSIKNLNVYVTGQNLFVITKFTGFDPEVNVDKNRDGVPSAGIEYIPYPSARTFTFGVNLSL
ncbi:SusC/RagA family TonB-linked outer membrane protein [Pedobacter sandarakinus]|uniref:SusC/RagA family TonB-linked outer membrane protein n=1 Tax=Pedobacter sandarakinus TaxID=353156 RepID=UPI002247C025|nr:SusC/RagA family TonB-linked outer membrane protein [Pedobacter sandarakinus]MCX2575109.1 SusC/RagA family TonB-linked outer membrane protein [Pedobacter sandarakinus]